MAVTLNANSSTGFIATSDTSGVLQLQTGGTTAVTVDASQNVTLAGTLTATGVTTVPAGTVSAPAITTTGDTNTGIYFPAADTIAFSEGGAEAMRINSIGNLLLATTANNLLWFNDTTYGNRFLIEQNGAPALASYVTQGLVRNTNDAEATFLAFGKSRGTTAGSATVVSSGDGLGAISFQGADGTNLVEAARITGAVDGTPGANDMPGRLVFSTTADGASTITERARITSAGDLLVGGTSKLSGGVSGLDINSAAAAGLTIGRSGTSKVYFYLNTDAGSAIYQTASGTVANVISGGTNGVTLANGGTSWGSLSDERKKDIIEPIVDAATKVSSLRAVIGKYKTEEDGIRRAMLIAQDVQAVLPEAVVENKDGDLILQYTDTIPLLVAAIKEQQAIITQLQADVAALKGK